MRNEFIENNAGTVGEPLGMQQACIHDEPRDPGADHHPLCVAMIGEKVDLVTTLMGVCGFKTDIKSVETFCKSGTAPVIGTTMTGTNPHSISALNFLTDTNRFLTFSGSAGVEFQWDVAEARGTDASVTTEGSFEDGYAYDGNFGVQIGRRLTDDESSSSSGPVVGYAYPRASRARRVQKAARDDARGARGEAALVEEARLPRRLRRSRPGSLGVASESLGRKAESRKAGGRFAWAAPAAATAAQGPGLRWWGHEKRSRFCEQVASANKRPAHAQRVCFPKGRQREGRFRLASGSRSSLRHAHLYHPGGLLVVPRRDGNDAAGQWGQHP